MMIEWWMVLFFLSFSYLWSLRSSIGSTVIDLAVQNHQSQCIEYFKAGGDSHLTNHMTCMNGRRKRMQTGEEAQLDMDSAKRSKLESGTYILYFRCLSKLQEFIDTNVFITKSWNSFYLNHNFCWKVIQYIKVSLCFVLICFANWFTKCQIMPNLKQSLTFV